MDWAPGTHRVEVESGSTNGTESAAMGWVETVGRHAVECEFFCFLLFCRSFSRLRGVYFRMRRMDWSSGMECSVMCRALYPDLIIPHARCPITGDT